MTLGQLMATVRSGKGLSMEKCAERMAVTQPAWSDWENDKVANPRRVTVQKIAAALGESPDAFLQAAGLATDEKTDVRLAQRLERHLRHLKPDQRAKVEEALDRDAANYVSLLSA